MGVDALQRSGHGEPFLYGTIPPPADAYAEYLPDRVAGIDTLLDTVSVDAVYVYEVVEDESRNGERSTKQKADPRRYAQDVKDRFAVDVIVSHPVRQHTGKGDDTLEDWLDGAVDAGVDGVVLVGGESSDIQYPGPTVPEAAAIASEYAEAHAPGLVLGGVTIPSRRRETLDEPERIRRKEENGIDFFASQILYTADSATALLQDLDALYAAPEETPPRCVLNFAPVDCASDVAFYEWLDVEMPEAVKQDLFAEVHPTDYEASADARNTVAEQSITHVQGVWEEIQGFVDEEELSVPLGLQVERPRRHLTPYVTRLAEELQEVQHVV